MNEKFCKKFQMFLVITSIGGVSFKIFHPKRHTWKNNNEITKNGNFEPLYLGNPLWSRQCADVGFLYGSISITIYRSHFGRMNFFFFLTQCYFQQPLGIVDIPWIISFHGNIYIHIYKLNFRALGSWIIVIFWHPLPILRSFFGKAECEYVIAISLDTAWKYAEVLKGIDRNDD